MLTEYKGREGDLLKNLKSIKANQQVTDEDGDTAFSFYWVQLKINSVELRTDYKGSISRM
jgi:hypothetical protein